MSIKYEIWAYPDIYILIKKQKSSLIRLNIYLVIAIEIKMTKNNNSIDILKVKSKCTKAYNQFRAQHTFL